jgi:hypothetical protein
MEAMSLKTGVVIERRTLLEMAKRASTVII